MINNNLTQDYKKRKKYFAELNTNQIPRFRYIVRLDNIKDETGKLIKEDHYILGEFRRKECLAATKYQTSMEKNLVAVAFYAERIEETNNIDFANISFVNN